MKNRFIDRTHALCRGGLLAALLATALVPPAGAEDLAAVPGGAAMRFRGFGADTPGGAGGRVIKVTNLKEDGEGSLKAALEATGARIVVFEVGGIIDWKKQEVVVASGRLTLAGETAPNPGVTIIRGSLTIKASDVIVRHLRVRCGDGGDLKSPDWEGDSMAVVGPNARNVLIDHCSTSWSVDENLSVSGPRIKDGTASFVTIRNCLIGEALDKSTHPKGPHSKGTLIHDFVHHVALAGNFYAHNFNRNPFLKPNSKVFMANNLIYDPGSAAVHFSYVPSEYKVIDHPMLPGELTAIGTTVRFGATTRPTVTLFSTTPADAPPGVGKLYQRESRLYGRDGECLWDGATGESARFASTQVIMVSQPMLWPEGFQPLDGSMTEAYVLKNAGARPKARDPVDQRIIDNYRARAGRVIDSQDEVGGYPQAEAVHRPLSVPESVGEIEAWLAAYRHDVEY